MWLAKRQISVASCQRRSPNAAESAVPTTSNGGHFRKIPKTMALRGFDRQNFIDSFGERSCYIANGYSSLVSSLLCASRPSSNTRSVAECCLLSFSTFSLSERVCHRRCELTSTALIVPTHTPPLSSALCAHVNASANCRGST